MKVTTISYERLINLGNYENEKISLSVELQGETAKNALIAMKEFCDSFVSKTKDIGYLKKDFSGMESLKGEKN
jgi:hypothetical protein